MKGVYPKTKPIFPVVRKEEITMTMRQAKASKDDIQSLVNFFTVLEEAIEYQSSRGCEERLGEIVGECWDDVACSWRRVVFGCEMLIENCCDPELSYLDWRKDVREFLESKSVEEKCQ